MLLSLLLGLVATLIVFPETPISRALHRLLVEPLARRLERVRFGHALFGVIVTGLGAALFLMFEGEGLKLFSLMAPEVVTWFAMFDVALFLDVFAMALAVAATTRLRAVRDQVIAGVRLVPGQICSVLRGGRQRARRDKSTTARPKHSDDPEPFGAGYAFG